MTFHQRIDVEESIETVVLRTFVARNLSGYDFTEDGSHGDYSNEMFVISSCTVPCGILISATSPTFLPNNPCAMGV